MNACSGVDDQVQGGKPPFRLAEPFPEEPLGAIALHGTAHAPSDRDPQPWSMEFVFQDKEDETSGGNLPAPLVDLLELAAFPDPVRWGEGLSQPQTARRFRPFRRRRFRTSRPSWVLMRSRKPCFLLRRRLFGWKVRFMPRSLSRVVRS